MYLIETSEGENRGEAMFEEIIAKNFSGQRKLSKSIVFLKYGVNTKKSIQIHHR